ncbi:MAG: hypothetical protein MHM6MM_001450 [Cercozoa sp. M6MM]
MNVPEAVRNDLTGCVFRMQVGYDTDGCMHDNVAQAWRKCENKWYQGGKKRWDGASADDDGMLGGLTQVHNVDVAHTGRFLDAIEFRQRQRCVDLGGGIGRVASSVLVPRFQQVDLVDATPHFVEKAKQSHGDKLHLVQCQPMQDFAPPANTYDLVFIQWACDFIRDSDIISLLQRCVTALKPGGRVVIKDNHVCSGSGGFFLDLTESSMLRTVRHLRRLFASVPGLRIVRSELQTDLSDDLHPVRCWELARAEDMPSETVEVNPQEHAHWCAQSHDQMLRCALSRLSLNSEAELTVQAAALVPEDSSDGDYDSDSDDE